VLNEKIVGHFIGFWQEAVAVMQTLCRHSGLFFAEVGRVAALAVFQIQTTRVDDET
jgi:hypothetical protein